MNAADFLNQLREQGVKLWAEGDRLKFRAPPGVMSVDVKEKLRLHKHDLILHLNSNITVAHTSVNRLPDESGQSPPLSFAQQSLWFLQQLYPESTASNEQFVLRYDGNADFSELSRAWSRLLQRHHILRTHFNIENGEPRQCVAADGVTLPEPLDWRSLSEIEAATRLQRLASREFSMGFDLLSGPLLRPLVCLLPANETIILVTAQHIIADGLSVPLLRRELAEYYAQPGKSRDQPLHQFADYARWEQSSSNAEWFAQEQDWWRNHLHGISGAPVFAGVSKGVAKPRSARFQFEIDATLAEQVRSMATAERATVFMVLLAAWRAWLSRSLSADDLLIGTPVTLRKDSNTAGMLGCLVNNVGLRNSLSADRSFRQLLQFERSELLTVLDHSQIPFERIVEAVQPERVLGRHPLFQLMFFYSEQEAPTLGFSNDVVVVDRDSFWDMDLTVTDYGPEQPLEAVISVRSDLIDRQVSSAWPESFVAALSSMLANPDVPLAATTLISEEQQKIQSAALQGPYLEVPEGISLCSMVRDQMVRTPDAISVRDENEQLSYRELEDRAGKYCAALINAGVKENDVVGIALGRSADSVALLLGILKCGAAWVACDPAFPEQRIRAMIRTAAPVFIIVDDENSWALSDQKILVQKLRVAAKLSVPPPQVLSQPTESSVCVLFTSGSTGEPKAVRVSQAAAISRCLWMWDAYHFLPTDNFAQRSSFNFVDVLWEIFGALIHGARVSVLPDNYELNPALFAEWLHTEEISHLVTVPTILNALLNENLEQATQLHTVISSGEALAAPVLQRFQQRKPGCRLLNTYGATEFWDATCADVSDLPVADTDLVPIGRPVANMGCHVLNAQRQYLPQGMPGELYVSGIGLVSGYLRNAAAAASAFITLDNSVSAYRTGDRARYRADGALELLGRVDRQMKLRGVRIEAADIEANALAYPGVAQSAVVLKQNRAAETLMLFVVSKVADELLTDKLHDFMRQRLPVAMVPAEIRCLDVLPLTPSGKTDFIALTTIAEDGSEAVTVTLPRNATEQSIAGVWSEVLGVAEIDIHADFFALGGHSLLATRVIAKLFEVCGVELPLQSLFEQRTVAGLAEIVTALEWASQSAAPLTGADSAEREVIRL